MCTCVHMLYSRKKLYKKITITLKKKKIKTAPFSSRDKKTFKKIYSIFIFREGDPKLHSRKIDYSTSGGTADLRGQSWESSFLTIVCI